MYILEERGLFWWADEPVPDHQFAPDSCIAGLLKIEDDGQLRLELDSYFPSKHGPMTPMMRRGLPVDRDIRGLLKTSSKHILLTGLIGDGGQTKTNGMSYERYAAGQCLVSEGLPVQNGALTFKEIDVPLAGFEEWLRLGDLRRSTLSWCRRTRISATNAARDWNSPIKAHQINLQRSLIGSEYQIRSRGQPF